MKTVSLNNIKLWCFIFYFKGSLTRDIGFRFFHESIFPRPEYTYEYYGMGGISNFSGDIQKFILIAGVNASSDK
jgi:hypothetical protein